MANLNKVILIGRLTRDPEVRMFSNGGKVAKFGFAVNNRRKNQQGQWEDEPVYLDVEAFNRGEFGKQADLVEQYLQKGRQVFLEGHLKLEQWNDKTSGEKRSKLVIVVDNLQFLDSKGEGGGGGPRGPASSRQSSSASSSDYDSGPEPMEPPSGQDKDIPF